MICKFCEKEFQPHSNRQLYCNSTCQRKAEYKRNGTKEKKKAICPVCGETFTKEFSRQIYCSLKCRFSQKEPEGYTEKPKQLDSISEFNKEARAVGMTYGQYRSLELKDITKVDIGGQTSAGR